MPPKIKVQKRSFTLLEVLIALALIVGCIIPLIYPHVVLFQAQNAFVSEMKVDRLVQTLYADTLVSLYRNEIPWNELESEKEVTIDPAILKNAGIPTGLFSGKTQWKIEYSKPKPPQERTVYLLELTFTFDFLQESTHKPLVYRYDIFVERILGKESSKEEAPEENSAEEAEEEEK